MLNLKKITFWDHEVNDHRTKKNRLYEDSNWSTRMVLLSERGFLGLAHLTRRRSALKVQVELAWNKRWIIFNGRWFTLLCSVSKTLVNADLLKKSVVSRFVNNTNWGSRSLNLDKCARRGSWAGTPGSVNGPSKETIRSVGRNPQKYETRTTKCIVWSRKSENPGLKMDFKTMISNMVSFSESY